MCSWFEFKPWEVCLITVFVSKPLLFVVCCLFVCFCFLFFLSLLFLVWFGCCCCFVCFLFVDEHVFSNETTDKNKLGASLNKYFTEYSKGVNMTDTVSNYGFNTCTKLGAVLSCFWCGFFCGYLGFFSKPNYLYINIF